MRGTRRVQARASGARRVSRIRADSRNHTGCGQNALDGAGLGWQQAENTLLHTPARNQHTTTANNRLHHTRRRKPRTSLFKDTRPSHHTHMRPSTAPHALPAADGATVPARNGAARAAGSRMLVHGGGVCTTTQQARMHVPESRAGREPAWRQQRLYEAAAPAASSEGRMYQTVRCCACNTTKPSSLPAADAVAACRAVNTAVTCTHRHARTTNTQLASRGQTRKRCATTLQAARP